MASLPGYRSVKIEVTTHSGAESYLHQCPLPQCGDHRLPGEMADGNPAGVVLQIVNAIASVMAKCDQTTAGHQDRVAAIACSVAREMEWNEEEIRAVRLAAALHDVGKMIVSQEILNKPGRLTAEEFAQVKLHPQAGYLILKDIPFRWPIAEAVRQHHERMNGSGYPRGLMGDEILPIARIVAIADVLDAMTSDRSYRPALELDVVLCELEGQAGTLLDAQMVKRCVSLFREKRCDLPCRKDGSVHASPLRF